MKASKFYIFLISVFSVKRIYGHDADLEECKTKFTDCFLQRNCESRIKVLDYYCCKSGFADDKFNETLEEECMEDRVFPDIFDCLEEEKECSKKLGKFFMMNLHKLEQFEEELKKNIEEPKTKEECQEYAKRVEKEECLLCSDKDGDDIYGFMCNLVRESRESSPYCKTERECIGTFTECFKREFDESKIKALDVECCKNVLNKNGDYFENKDACMEGQLEKTVISCIFEKEYYQQQIMKYFTNNHDLMKEFSDKIKNQTGIPTDETQCEKKYYTEKYLSLEECSINKNKKLAPICDFIEKILDNKELMEYNTVDSNDLK